MTHYVHIERESEAIRAALTKKIPLGSIRWQERQDASLAALDSLLAYIKQLEATRDSHMREIIGTGKALANADDRIKQLKGEWGALEEKPNQPLLNAARRLVKATDNAERNYALADLVAAFARTEEPDVPG